jgi:hypothetical protein
VCVARKTVKCGRLPNASGVWCCVVCVCVCVLGVGGKHPPRIKKYPWSFFIFYLIHSVNIIYIHMTVPGAINIFKKPSIFYFFIIISYIVLILRRWLRLLCLKELGGSRGEEETFIVCLFVCFRLSHAFQKNGWMDFTKKFTQLFVYIPIEMTSNLFLL